MSATHIQSARAPSLLDLIRLGSRPPFPPGGEDLYRHIALLASVGPGCEILDVGCGAGEPLEYLVRAYGAQGSGVDPDPTLIALAAQRTIAGGLQDEVQFQEAPVHMLPYRDEVFDVVIGELALTAWTDPTAAVRELVRVARIDGSVVLIQPVWTRPLTEERRARLVERLGVRPLTRPEWKHILEEAGVANLHAEDWSNDQTAFRSSVRTPLPDFTKVYSLRERLGVMRRAWGRWGWVGARSTFALGSELHRLLARDRIVSLELMVGTKTGLVPSPALHDPEADMSLFRSRQDGAPPRVRGRGVRHAPEADALTQEETDSTSSANGSESKASAEVSGLPLFARKGKDNE